jgi:hypothetical protein
MAKGAIEVAALIYRGVIPFATGKTNYPESLIRIHSVFSRWDGQSNQPFLRRQVKWSMNDEI